MESNGLIHEDLDIKILILYILNRLPAPVDDPTLAELCQCDEGVRYFEYAENLSELVDTGHVVLEDGLYAVTEKGRRNGETIQSSLPYTVRAKAERALSPVAELLNRRAMIKASHEREENGLFVTLSASDGVSDLMVLRLLTTDEETAEKMEQTFRRDAEKLYGELTQRLLGEEAPQAEKSMKKDGEAG